MRGRALFLTRFIRAVPMVSSVSTANLCCTKYALETALQCIRKKLDVEYNILLCSHKVQQ
ncbi:hypothetical protein BDA96_04G206100 [Sorghum bicolor]|uniref:Secreted protein n=2 Tax=Sorghum bicolor TaxID=4558 RepID=A0A921R5A0_SORBI|nr:hypothetical protein BDA96_04G206100 [Sorghum bicolor]KXG30509.1 hypothetical protein SORBI_3004G193600 [Sorghum bicolor]